MRAKILAMATAKGGAGKSTVAAALACSWLEAGLVVALVDADPNGTLARWHAKGGPLAQATLRAAPDGESLRRIIGDLALRAHYVIIDLPGSVNPSVLEALGLADLVVIPVLPDEASVYEAFRLVRYLGQDQGPPGRTVDAVALLSRAKRTSVTTHARSELQRRGIPLFESVLGDRSAFQEASFLGSSPIVSAPRSPAALEITNLVSEIVTRLSAADQRRRTA